MAGRVSIPGEREPMLNARGNVNSRWRRFFNELSGQGADPGDTIIVGDDGIGYDDITTVVEDTVARAERVDFIDDTPGAGQTTIYKAYADAGSADSAAVWRISKLVLDTDDDLVTTYADGDTDYDNIWTDRLSLSYS